MIQVIIVLSILAMIPWSIRANNNIAARNTHCGRTSLCPDCGGGLLCVHATSKHVDVIQILHGSPIQHSARIPMPEYQHFKKVHPADTLEPCRCRF